MEWLSDELAAATANAHVEGADYVFARRNPRVRTGNYTQVFVTPVEVSDTQRAVETAGLEDEYAYQMAKALKEHARDIEYAFASTANTGNSGASGTARQLKGVMAWITTTNITGTGSGDETLTETMFNDALQAIWNKGGRPDAVYANGFQKRKISGFTASSTKFVEASEKEIVAGVDVLTKNIAHLKLGHMLENPKALNAKGSCETTLIMVKSGRKFKRCNNGQSAGKITQPSKILRDYTPSSQCGDDIVRPLMRVREVGRNVQPYFSNKSDDSDFGRVKIVADRYMNAAQVAILQSDLWKTAVLRPTKHIEVAKVGSATRGVIETELTLESRNEAGSGKITELKTS